MFGQENVMTIKHDILKENHETLLKDYESLQERIKLEEETYEILKKQFQIKNKELEVANTRLLADCKRERAEKEKYKKLVEEIKTIEGNKVSKVTIDELKKKNQELLLAKKKEEEDFKKMQNKYVELAEKFGVVEAECAYLKSLYDAEVAASGTGSGTPVMSGIGETENLIIGNGRNEVNNNVKNNVTDAIMISDESDAEHDNPPKESNIASQQSVERNQEEQCKKRANSLNENRALGETVTPRSVHHPPPPFSPSSSTSTSTSSSSSSDGYKVVVKLPPNWPDWASPKGRPNKDSNKL